MAFYNKVGSIARQSNAHISSVPSMLNAIRAMSSSKLFIGAKIITDRDSGRSKGFGFVTFADSESASSAVSAMDGQPLNGRNIRVSFANDKPRNTFGDNSGGGGGYGNAGF
ncbi:glycine-rich RNA-binding protein 2, mitochondrial isoform X2 [Daucus carota subsp. sativus]|uniref:glycine-rich RNA-binding protein 2, mitochondrial isoform X2 n=1 Tax=Daucus carota subsp. sativus TaxID=79200 RepID=UPI0007EFFAC8|nr:PREDICTED: glycine-rich RNA-binding protein 2, mitochondrial-like isoform X2 [Daucus carota subsp. sativus]